jgi:flagellar protein FliL
MFDFTQRVTAMPRLHANSARFSARLLLAAALMLGLATSAWSSSAPPPGANSEFPYVELSPSFVTNYDGGGRLRYLKVDVSVRTARPGDEVLRHHMPYVRSRLVELFSGQLEENLTSTEGKEKLRQDALALIREAIDLVEGDGSENILDLFFTSYVIQQ